MKPSLVALLLFLLWNMNSDAQSLYVQDGDIFLKDEVGTATRLTASGLDSSPIFSPDSTLVAFIRTTSGKPIVTGSGDGNPTELWIYDLTAKKAQKLVAPMQSNNMEQVLADFSDIQFSNDSKTIFFMSQAWTTSDAIHKVDVTTKEESFVAPGLSMKLISRGNYAGDIRVTQHRYHKRGGSYDCDYTLTPEGKEVTVVKGSCDE